MVRIVVGNVAWLGVGRNDNQRNARAVAEEIERLHRTGQLSDQTFAALAQTNNSVTTKLENAQNLSSLADNDRRQLRTDFYLISGSLTKLIKSKVVSDTTFTDTATKYRTSLDSVTKFIPDWVKVGVACALGFGMMVGWKRIVVTVGEKIGKSHLTYAQGACAEFVAACTIRLADVYGLPVSTTHVLSSELLAQWRPTIPAFRKRPCETSCLHGC